MIDNKLHICHLTSAHPDGDVRIFHKQCASLAAAGYKVSLVIPNTESRIEKGVYISSFECKYKSRRERMTITVKKVLKEALKLDANIYHIHDPELLKITKKLKRKGKKVIYDVHEDLPRQIMSKYWIPKYLRSIISKSTELFENKIARNLNGIVTATPFIEERFLKINPNTIAVNNFPILTELLIEQDYKLKTENNICYVGGITKTRGIFELADGLTKSSAKLLLAGNYLEGNIRDVLLNHPAWKKIKELGFLNRNEVKEVYKKSKVGIVTLHPTVNYIDSLPVKMFEYMAAGIPVVASNFKLWKSIVEDNNCGICVDPLNHEEITNAVEKLLKNPEIAKKMGENGQKLVKNNYNWKNEEKKLLTFYKSLIE
jgi:glycosyltransferase involved in cell wall biosynthesis